MWNETRAEFSTMVTKPENGEEKQFGEKGNDVSRHIVLYIKADCFHTVEDTQEQDGPNSEQEWIQIWDHTSIMSAKSWVDGGGQMLT